MKKSTMPTPRGWSRAGAGFSFLAFWQQNRAGVLLALLVVIAVVLFFLWLARRRRQDTFPEIKAEQRLPNVDLGITQIETAGEQEARPVGPSPGIHGKIEVLVNDRPISTYLVTDNPLPIGRDPGQSLVIIQEPIVSKLHCQIFFRNGQVVVRDLNSTNGVYVNEAKVSEQELQDNDVVFLGKKGTVKIVYHR
ncbi:MAG: FHA domain-containing protein [Candidatus Aminicenantes bacterium]|nr:FHA domain-containing protein [Candidatus Aminicenantes bacterium]